MAINDNYAKLGANRIAIWEWRLCWIMEGWINVFEGQYQNSVEYWEEDKELNMIAIFIIKLLMKVHKIVQNF